MKNFLRNVIKGNGIIPPPKCEQAFHQSFEDALNVDWYDKNGGYEVIFYKDKLEHIAQFNLDGSLLEYSLNIPEGYLPEIIKESIDSKGEIMNSVMRNRGNTVEYEIIVKDKELNRLLITFSNIGELLEERIL